MKKIILSVFLVYFFTSNISGVFALGSSLIDPREAMNDIFEDLGIEKDSVKDTAQTFNVSNFKKNPPQVSLVFSPKNPIPGEKITATAMPMYFMNDFKNLYFTWYLRNAECKKYEKESAYKEASKETRDRIKKICDLNEDEIVDIEDYKIKAAQIRVNSGYDKNGAIYSSQERRSKGLSADGDSYKAPTGGADQGGKKEYCFYHDVKTGKDKELPNCGHLFPSSYSMDASGNIRKDGGQMGKGLFDENDASKEHFWQSNPDDPDTAGVGTVDEATIIGLGATEFSWIYLADDEIGVVVEGISSDTVQEYDSSYKTMWALLKNKCETIPKEVSDFNKKCLMYNFISPSEETGINSKIDISLISSPSSPINDASPEGQAGDELSFIASVSNVSDQSYLNYQWEIFLAESMNPTDWGTALIKSKLPNASQTSGIGINTFKFNMNLKEDIIKNNKYIKARVTVTNPKSKKSTDRGTTETILPIISSSEYLKIYTASVSENLSNATINEKEICLKENSNGKTNALPESICNVYKNELIALKISDSSDFNDFSWKIDGKPIECVFPDICGTNNESYKNLSFFPILKEVGKNFTATLEAINKNNGEKISLSRYFSIVEPEIKIISADQNTSRGKLLGHFTDLDGKEYPDYDKDNFEALSNNKIKLRAVPSGGSSAKTTYLWYVNNELVDGTNYQIEDNVLILPGKNTDEFYDVSVVANYTQDVNTKKALNKYYEVNYNNFYEKQYSDSIRINMVDSFFGDLSSDVSQKPTTKKIFATVISGLPSYIAFLLKTIISVGLIVFIIKIIFSFTPKTKEYGD